MRERLALPNLICSSLVRISCLGSTLSWPFLIAFIDNFFIAICHKGRGYYSD